MENPSENEDESEGDDEPALLDPSPKRKVVRSLFDELDFLDDFENFSDFDKHLKSANKEESEDAHDGDKLQKNPIRKIIPRSSVWCQLYLLPLPYLRFPQLNLVQSL